MADESPLSTGWSVYGVASVVIPPVLGYMWVVDDPGCIRATSTQECESVGESLIGTDWTYGQATGYGYVLSIVLAVAVVVIVFLAKQNSAAPPHG